MALTPGRPRFVLPRVINEVCFVQAPDWSGAYHAKNDLLIWIMKAYSPV